MGKPSNTNPMRVSARPTGEILYRLARLCLLLGLMGTVATLAGAQTQTTTLPLVLPSAIVFDAQGNLYFAETGNHVIREFSIAGVLTTIAGKGVQGFAGDGGPAMAAELDSPAGLAMDGAGNLYIADSHNHRVREVDAATGVIRSFAGTGVAGFSGDGGAATAAELDLPTALAVDAAGNVYVADTDNHRVRRIAAGTGLITTVAGNGAEGFAGDGSAAIAASIDSPNGLVVDVAGNMFIADTHNGRVRKVSASTSVITTIAGAGVVGGNTQTFGGDGAAATAAGLALPRGLTMDAAGNLYIADSANHRIRRISTSGTIATIAGEGTEAFAGDGGPAVAASLDSPRSVVISPGGLVTLADSGNHRVRQIDAQPGPGPDIHTITGIGAVGVGTLSLSGPAVVTYGSGALTATLRGDGSATGSVTFMDTSSGATATAGVSSLGADSAVLSTASLAAGSHTIVAVYSGDATHLAAQSSGMALIVGPLGLTVTANPVAILYGQPVPVLSGVVSGVLVQDAGKVVAVFTTGAAALSAVGVYPIAATLTGSAAGNYAVTATPANLSIAQAPTLTSLTASTSAAGLGLPVTLTMKAASTTSGMPTGSVTVLDGATVLSVVPLSAGGAVFSTSALTLGAHNLSAVYSGDSNFLPSGSVIASITVGGAVSDFTLASVGTILQTVTAGSAATFNFSVAMQGAALASPITLAVQGAPVGATVSLNPSSLPPGGAVTAFTLTIQTPLAGMDRRFQPLGPGSRDTPDFGAQTLLALLLLPAIGLVRRSRLMMRGVRMRSAMVVVLAATSCILFATLATGCGNRINMAADSVTAKVYTLTVTGTATSPVGTALQHSAVVTLDVN
jgi:sugar lactone lactonase YvrE